MLIEDYVVLTEKIEFALVSSKIENVPRSIQDEKLRKDKASS